MPTEVRAAGSDGGYGDAYEELEPQPQRGGGVSPRAEGGSCAARVERGWDEAAEAAWRSRREPWVPSSFCPRLLDATGQRSGGGSPTSTRRMRGGGGLRSPVRGSGGGGSPTTPPTNDMLVQLDRMRRAAAVNKWVGGPSGVMADTQWEQYLRRTHEPPLDAPVVDSMMAAQARSSKQVRAKRVLREARIAAALKQEAERSGLDLGRNAARKRVARFRQVHTTASVCATVVNAPSPYATKAPVLARSPSPSPLGGGVGIVRQKPAAVTGRCVSAPPGESGTTPRAHALLPATAAWQGSATPATRQRRRGKGDAGTNVAALAADPTYAPFLVATGGGVGAKRLKQQRRALQKQQRQQSPPAPYLPSASPTSAIAAHEVDGRARIAAEEAAAQRQLANVAATGTAGYLHADGLEANSVEVPGALGNDSAIP